MRKRWQVVVAVLVLGLALPAVADQRPLGTFDRTYSVNGPVQLSVNTRSGDVSVRTANESVVRVHALVWSNRHPQPEWRDYAQKLANTPPIVQEGNSIRIEVPADLPREVDINFQISVPADTSVRTTTASGDLKVDGLHGSVNATAASGDVQVTGVTGDVRSETASGDVDLRDVEGAINARAASGDVQLANVRGSVTVATASGDIVIRSQPTQDWTISTGSGDATVDASLSSSFSLRATTGSGDIHAGREVQVEERGRNWLRGKVGQGGKLITISTGSGDISIR